MNEICNVVYLDGLQAKVNAPSAFGTSPKFDIESMNVNEALACRIWRRKGSGASLRELQSATGEELRRRQTSLPSHKGMISVLRPSGVGV